MNIIQWFKDKFGGKNESIPQKNIDGFIKYWTYGKSNKYQNEALINFFSQRYQKKPILLYGRFKKEDWVYYFDANNNLCETNNQLVINLLKQSDDWIEYTLPETKKYTKEEIAHMIGMDVTQFEIV